MEGQMEGVENRTEAESRDESWNDGIHGSRSSSPSSSRSSSPATSPSLRTSSAGAFAEEKYEEIKPTTASRLLLSFIEIYALNYYNLPSADDKVDAMNRLQSIETLHPRLITFFTKNKYFLW